MSKNGSPVLWEETPAGQQVKARMAEEKTLLALDKILARLDTVEEAVSGLATAMHQGPGMVAMVADMADETYRRTDANGVNIETRLKGALEIAEKLTAPAMVDKLNNLLTVTDQLPGLIAMTADMADEAYRQADNRGVSIEQRLGVALELAEKLTEPTMVNKLSGALAFANQLPGLIAMGMDTLDEGMRQARENGLEPETMIEWAAQFGSAMRETQAEPPTKVGAFGMLTALRDPDRQKALGFSLNFLKHLGKQL
ncbi:DUF1641 domain-containing protein [Lewinella cohaerens]|uniref:DUF1641 domain-containing protein n=1 Tax=Lewinella cohaerens TaxID=70995 RepID=UPI000368B8E4|nr:DUF1641 domain-containing protein [Lewinella cohaerens]